jgi:sulfate adenylyltransferase subunit 1
MAAVLPNNVTHLRPTLTRQRPVRFLMAGSVDDGKSTLTGRLLFDAQAILSDQLDRLMKGGEAPDLSLLTDGLEAEREQGITIDVAYRYFSTRARKFIIADAPGHEQYTRNMVTAAAGSDAAVILVDITKIDFSANPIVLLPQTRRHTLLAHMLRVPSIVFAINKIDAVPNPSECFERVREALIEFCSAAGVHINAIVPISALHGHNVTLPGETAYYDGPPLLTILETLPIETEEQGHAPLMPVQYVSRDTTTGTDMSSRVIWGRIARGSITVGDRVQVFPSNEVAVVKEIRHTSGLLNEGTCWRSVGLVLDRELDVTRGCWIAEPHTVSSTRRFCASIAWMDTEPAQVGRKYMLRHGSRYVQGRIVMIESSLDVHTLDRTGVRSLNVNDIGTVVIETQQPLPLEPFQQNRDAGSLIVIDPATNHTSGVLLVDRLRWDFGTADDRASRRIDAQFEVTINDGGENVGGTAVNVSTGGLLLHSDDLLMVGGDVVAEFTLPGESAPLSVRANVLAHEPRPDAGYRYHLSFFDLQPDVHERLSSLAS